MTQHFRVAQRLRLAHEHLGWMSIHLVRVPVLAGAIATAAEDLKRIEAVLHTSKRTRPDGAGADTILRPFEQRLLELVANVEIELGARGPAPSRAPASRVDVVSDPPRGEGLDERIALSDSDVVRLRAIATHPSARDGLGRAAATLLDVKRWLAGDRTLEVLERAESALEVVARRVRAVQEAVDRFGPAAIVETVERPRHRR